MVIEELKFQLLRFTDKDGDTFRLPLHNLIWIRASSNLMDWGGRPEIAFFMGRSTEQFEITEEEYKRILSLIPSVSENGAPQ